MGTAWRGTAAIVAAFHLPNVTVSRVPLLADATSSTGNGVPAARAYRVADARPEVPGAEPFNTETRRPRKVVSGACTSGAPSFNSSIAELRVTASATVE